MLCSQRAYAQVSNTKVSESVYSKVCVDTSSEIIRSSHFDRAVRMPYRYKLFLDEFLVIFSKSIVPPLCTIPQYVHQNCFSGQEYIL